MIGIKAHFDGKVIVPDEPVDLPKGQQLIVQIKLVQKVDKQVKKTAKPVKKPRRKKPQSVLDWLAENAVEDDDLPTDLAHQHDHYLYGTPKKPAPKL
jgi:hypothetical protein